MAEISNLPTLLRSGYINPNPKLKLSKTAINSIKNMRSIDYIMNHISDMIPISFGLNAKIPAKSLGDRVIVLKSDTGSGKSTVMPPYLYKIFQDRTRKNIAITQPRVLTAIDISENLPENYNFLKMDVNIGYSTGDYKREPKNKGIIFMTSGILMEQLKSTPDIEFIKKYSFILIDEVHDRDLKVDMSLYMLKKFLYNNYKNPECPIIILMSATFDPTIFMDYYKCPDENYIQVIGSTFPIEKHFLKFDSPDFVKYAADKAEEIHISNISDITDGGQFRDIIIFVSGKLMATSILEKLHTFNAKVLSKPFSDVLKYLDNKKRNETKGGDDENKRYFVAPINLNRNTFQASGVEYQNMFSNINDITFPIYKLDNKGNADLKMIDKWVKPSRRIIVATPIAETGVTIDTLKYCIDTGFLNDVQFNPDFDVKSIIDKQVTKGMATQRKGRVGRKAPGEWYPCYTEKTFNELANDQFAEILRSDITSELLNMFIKETETTIIENESENRLDEYLCNNNLFLTNYLSNSNYFQLNQVKKLNIAAIDFLESPSANSLVYSTEKLYGMGFINSKYDITILGMYANSIRKISIECKRMLLAGYSYGANILDLITIISFVTVERKNILHRKYKPININPKKLTDAEYEFYYKILIGDEFVEYLFIWEMYSEVLDTMMKDIKNKVETGKKYIFNISNIEQWCLDNKLLHDGINKVSLVRDEIIEDLINIGINPYWNGLGIERGSYSLLKLFRENLDECVGEVKKIKQCIVDGFRFNLLIWDNSVKKYILHHRNIPVMVKSNVLSKMGENAVQTNANFIISSNIMLKQAQNNKDVFQFENTGSISIIDSYLDIDLGFLYH